MFVTYFKFKTRTIHESLVSALLIVRDPVYVLYSIPSSVTYLKLYILDTLQIGYLIKLHADINY